MEMHPIPAPAPAALSPSVYQEVLQTCGSFNLRKAARAVTQMYDEILQPTGLRSTQVVLLVLLAAEHECSLSRSLQPLVRDGLVALVQAGRRGKRVRLTPAGHHALRAAVPYWHQAQERFLRLVGPESWTQVNERLAQIVVVTRA